MKAVEWRGGSIRFLDQTKLPLHESYDVAEHYRQIAEAIRTLKIRGAPLIGIAGAYALALAAQSFSGDDLSLFRSYLNAAAKELAATRPTAVNLFWALDRMDRAIAGATTVRDCVRLLVSEAAAIDREDDERCRRIGENGETLIPDGAAILTHCNTGALATGGRGTALGVITTAHERGKRLKVYADETRPLLQGARLTTWELMRAGIEVVLITDSTAAVLLREKKVGLVMVGADRIASNGDTANKIGTYGLAVLARHHGIPFYVAAPGSTIDASARSGGEIPIEERDPREVREIMGKQIAPPEVRVYAPAFDVTPSSLITAIVTEDGIHRPPYRFS